MVESTDVQDESWKRPFNNSVNLYRGLHKCWIIGNRVSSAAFKDKECSVNRSDMRTTKETLRQNNSFKGVAELNYQYPISLGLDVLHIPLLNNKAHCIIKGIRGKLAKKLALAASIILER